MYLKLLQQVAVVVVLLAGMTEHSHAQDRPPASKVDIKNSVFRNMQQQIELKQPDHLFSLALREGQKTSFFLSPEIVLEGRFLSETKPNAHLTTLQFQAENMGGALLTISKVQDEDGFTTFAGRIFHRESGEAYILTTEKNKYFFTKTPSRFLLTD